MKVRLLLIMLCCMIALIASFARPNPTLSQDKQTPDGGLSPAENDLFSEINQARTHPDVYATYLEKLKPSYNGREYKASEQDAFTTQEGWSAVEDAIKFLRAAKPQSPLNRSQGLCLAALTHVKEQSASGATGHKGADSTLIEERVKPFGTWQGGIGENLSYGNQSARERILTWLIDDGFANRGHRNRIMSENYRVAGVSCGPHPEFGAMCVLTLAGGFVELQPAKPATSSQTNSNTNANSTNSNSRKSTTRKPTKSRSH
jgi:uncharacterized protein YkwD